MVPRGTCNRIFFLLLYLLNFSFAHLQKLNYEISEFKIYRANNKPTKTLEQREAEYAEARKRILGSTSSTEVKEETIITNNRCVLNCNPG